MAAPDDEQFEHYLKQFRPLLPEPLPMEERRMSRRSFALRVLVAAAVAILILGEITLHFRSNRIAAPSTTIDTASDAELLSLQPLTVRNANALLTTAPSVKAALDNMAFRSGTPRIPKDKQSTVAVLGEEKIKL